VISLLGYYDRHLEFLFGMFSTFHYLDCLAYGCMMAMFFTEKPAQLKAFFARYSLPIFSLACLFLVVPAIVGLGKGLQSLAFIFLLLQSVLFPELAVFRFLNNRWLVRIGIWSYSIYIWQELIFLLWPFPSLWFLALPATILAGWASYNFIEKPFLSLRTMFSRAKLPLILATN
jgi:peptidoglycan/LPS O-acetylase OafA/YrhL